MINIKALLHAALAEPPPRGGAVLPFGGTVTRGCAIIPFPPEYPGDGRGVSIGSYGGNIICAHPDHPPYILRGDVWERIEDPAADTAHARP